MCKSISVIILMNGLKIQWRRGLNKGTNNFPINFTSGSSYVITGCGNGENHSYAFSFTSLTASTFSLFSQSSMSANCIVIAIGY